jgi:hypothetical protein
MLPINARPRRCPRASVFPNDHFILSILYEPQSQAILQKILQKILPCIFLWKAGEEPLSNIVHSFINPALEII